MAKLLLVTMVLTASLSSCSWMGRHGDQCHEAALPANTENRPPLRAAPGLETADTRNAVRVPELNEPEQPRSSSDRCLSTPPSYGS